MNKKVRGAEDCFYNGVHFKSKLEKRAAIALDKMGIEYKYEPKSFILVEGFKPKVPYIVDSCLKTGKVRNLSYTPDFRIKINGYTVFIEMKGFANDAYPIRRKLFLKYLERKTKCIFVEAHTITDLRNSVLLLKEYTL